MQVTNGENIISMLEKKLVSNVIAMPYSPDRDYKNITQPADEMSCRPGCGACCIAPSITSRVPGMPDGKPAGVRCIHLDEEARCGLFNSPSRPGVCADFRAQRSVCGNSTLEALQNLADLEKLTSP